MKSNIDYPITAYECFASTWIAVPVPLNTKLRWTLNSYMAAEGILLELYGRVHALSFAHVQLCVENTFISIRQRQEKDENLLFTLRRETNSAISFNFFPRLFNFFHQVSFLFPSFSLFFHWTSTFFHQEWHFFLSNWSFFRIHSTLDLVWKPLKTNRTNHDENKINLILMKKDWNSMKKGLNLTEKSWKSAGKSWM